MEGGPTRYLRCCLVSQFCAQSQVLGDVLEVVGDPHPRAGEKVRVAHGEGGGVVVSLVVRGQLQGLPLGLLYLGHHLTPGESQVRSDKESCPLTVFGQLDRG